MRIGIDARLFVGKNYTGIARSVDEVLKCWEKKFPMHEFYLFSGKRINLNRELPNNWHVMDDPWIIDSSKLWSLVKLPKLIKELKLDIYWGTNYVLPRKNRKTKYVVTVYDLALFKFQGIGAFKNTMRVKTLTKAACENANKIIAISKATADDIQEILNIAADKIVVSYCGGLSGEHESGNNAINPILMTDNKFFLFISTIEPRKNIINIVKGFEEYIDRTGSKNNLVLAGKKGWRCDEIYETIENSKYRDRIIMPGYISDDDKEYLMRNAIAFVYPSLYEGFGIPIIEAFTYELPVITSNVSSMPEVGGNAAVYVDPYSVNEISMALEKMASMSDADKMKLKESMKERVDFFSWEKNAEEIMAVFENLINDKSV